MNKTAVSSTTDSWGMGVSRPIVRKGIMLFTSVILGLVKGAEVWILGEDGDYYKVRSVDEPQIVKYVQKDHVKEVDPYAR